MKCICLLFMKLINNEECLVYIHSLDFPLKYSYNKNCAWFINFPTSLNPFHTKDAFEIEKF